MAVPWCVCGGQRTNLVLLEFKLSSSGLLIVTFTPKLSCRPFCWFYFNVDFISWYFTEDVYLLWEFSGRIFRVSLNVFVCEHMYAVTIAFIQWAISVNPSLAPFEYRTFNLQIGIIYFPVCIRFLFLALFLQLRIPVLYWKYEWIEWTSLSCFCF